MQPGRTRYTPPAARRRPSDPAATPITRYDGAVTERAGAGLMTGPQDRTAEEGRSPETPRPRESDRVDAQLRERLERLPPNHPSSPYNDDGSRKPPPPDLSAYELPIPGDPDYQEADSTTDDSSEGEGVADEQPTPDSQPDRSLAAEDKPHISPDGSWEWQGYPLTAEQSRSADHRVETCKQAEGRDMNDGYDERGITPAMRRIEAQLEQGELVPDTEKYALKTADRFKEKLARMILEEPDADVDELISRIADGIRYTFCFPDSGYASGVSETRESLTSAGFQLYEQKNACADETKSYKGINSTWMDHDSGLLFEVQMHTAASWAAKQESHREYEILESRS